MSDHDPKDMLKTASEAENIGEMDEENGDEIFDKMIAYTWRADRLMRCR